MLTRRAVILRLGLCVFLGTVTAWLVAWGLAAAVWAEWLRSYEPAWPPTQYTVRGPHLIRLTRWENRAQTTEGWSVRRLDRDEKASLYAQRDRWIWSGKTEGSPPDVTGKVFLHPPPFEPKPTRQDELAAAFEAAGLSSFAGDETSTTIDRTTDGWPWRCLARARVSRGSPTRTDDRWTLTVDEFKRPRGPLGFVEPLQLSLRPIVPGLLLDTAAYGAAWALPLLGLPLLKQTRRRRKGRCPRCAYDLKRDLEEGCPECGWRRAAEQ
jgi:hypothetical protein